MRVAIVGTGIAGSVCALLLARRGHEVVAIDRDHGPVAGETWVRHGVMQFHQPHTWRGPARMVLAHQLPDVLAAAEQDGALSINRPGLPDAAAVLLCRRDILERRLWEAVGREAGVTRVTGHAEHVVVEAERAAGVVVDGATYAAALVVDAGGRLSKLSLAHRATPEGGTCGMNYTSQLFRLRPDADPGPVNSPVGRVAFHRGYQPIVFVHDNRTFSALIIRPSTDKELGLLRENAAFAAATATIPGLATWVEPGRSEPIGPVRTGGNLTNLYAGQPDLPGLVALGDALATTNPNGARGGSLGAEGALKLADILDVGDDPVVWRAEMDAWSEQNVRPWWADHVAIDVSLHRRWAGEPPDPDTFISSDLVSEAALDHPELMGEVGPYFGMLALPSSLDGARKKVRDLIRQGWAPTFPDGPSRNELVTAMRAVT